MLAQFFLTEQLAGRDAALKRLETQVAELADMLALERQASAELRESVAAAVGPAAGLDRRARQR